jgi:hypothetical protein
MGVGGVCPGALGGNVPLRGGGASVGLGLPDGPAPRAPASAPRGARRRGKARRGRGMCWSGRGGLGGAGPGAPPSAESPRGGRRAAGCRDPGGGGGGGGCIGGGSSMDWGTELWVSAIGPAPSSPWLGSGLPRFVPPHLTRVSALSLPLTPGSPPSALQPLLEFLREFQDAWGPGETLQDWRRETEAQGCERCGQKKSWDQAGAAGRGHLFWAPWLGRRLILRSLGPCPQPACPAGRGRGPSGHFLPPRGTYKY